MVHRVQTKETCMTRKRINRIELVSWVMEHRPAAIFDYDDMIADLKGSGEHIIDIGGIISKLDFIPGHLADPPVSGNIPKHEIELFYKDPFV